MRYAFMTFSTPQMTLDETIAIASRLGYAGIEPRVESEHGHGIELTLDAAGRAAVRQRFSAADVALCCIATSCRYADPATLDGHLESTRQYIRFARDVGCDRLRVFGGPIGEGLSRRDAIRQVVDALKSVSQEAEAHGVTLCVETHDDWTEPADMAAVMEGVDHPNIAVNWDVMHPQRAAGRTMDEAYAVLRPWIRYVHVHDGVDDLSDLRFRPMGEGDFDHRRVLELLKGDNYDGFISGEWINWEAPEVHLPREIAVLRAYEESIA